MNAKNDVVEVISSALVPASLAFILFMSGWGYCYLTGKHCTLTDIFLHGLAIFFIGLVFNLAVCVAMRNTPRLGRPQHVS